MVKAKRRVAKRKKASKRGKASAKPARKKAAKRATPKKRRAKTVAKTAPRKAPSKPPRRGGPVVEDTIIDVIDEPIPGVVRVTEYETIRTTTPKSGGGPETQ